MPPADEQASKKRKRLQDDELDKFIAERMHAYSIHDNTSFLLFFPFLLGLFNDAGCDELDPKYNDTREAMNLINGDDTLQEKLAACRQSGKYADIRYYPKLQIRSLTGGGKSPNSRQRGDPPTGILEHVKDAWDAVYKGDWHKLFYEALCTMRAEGEKKPYGNQVAIVQSSGYGKSRMVHELSKLVFTIPFCLRNPQESKPQAGFAYPPSDQSVYSYTTDQKDAGSQYEAEAAYLSLLKYIFTQSTTIIQDHVSQNGKFGESHELAAWWSTYLVDKNNDGYNRSQLYDESIVLAKADRKLWEGKRFSWEDEEKKEMRLGALDISSLTASHQSENDTAESEDIRTMTDEAAAASSALWELLESLKSAIKRPHDPEKSPVDIVIYFDEAHELDIPLSCRKSKYLYDVLATCLDAFRTQPMMIVSLSTVSKISKLAPAKDRARSSRITHGGAHLHVPWTEMPFDQHRSIIRPGQYTLSEISDISFLADFGRPLFGSLKESSDQILRLAKMKIIQKDVLDGIPPELSGNAKIALLDIQLMISYEPRYEHTQTLQNNLIAGHMRTAISCAANRHYMRSMYPSEPVLAEAAAQITNSTDNMLIIPVLNAELAEHLYLDRGEIGELGARIMLLSASHVACRQEQGVKVNYSKGCKVRSFFQALLEAPYADEALQSKPDNITRARDGKDSRPSLDEALGDGIIRFTHFIKSQDDSGVSQEGAYAAFLRCAAIICKTGQLLADLILPILVWDVKICAHVITFIGISVKRRKKGGSVLAYAIEEKKLGYFPRHFKHCKTTTDSTWTCKPEPPTESNLDIRCLPYISLILDIGVDSTLSPTGDNAQLTLTCAGIGTLPRAAKEPPAQLHPRYNILARGCSDKLFKPIRQFSVESWRKFLRLGNLLDEHQRQGKELHAVRRMKPYFERGPDSYHWVENEALRGQDAVEYLVSEEFEFASGFDVDDDE